MPAKKGVPKSAPQKGGSDKSALSSTQTSSQEKKQVLQNVNSKNSSLISEPEDITPPRKLSPVADNMTESMDSSFGDFSLATIHNIISANIEQYNMNVLIAERSKRLEHEGIGFHESDEDRDQSADKSQSESKLFDDDDSKNTSKVNALLGLHEEEDEPEEPRAFAPPPFEHNVVPQVDVPNVPTSYSIELMNAQMDRIFQRNEQLATALLLDGADATLQAESTRVSVNEQLPEIHDENNSNESATEDFERLHQGPLATNPFDVYVEEVATVSEPASVFVPSQGGEDVDFDKCLDALDESIDQTYEVIRSTLEAESLYLRASVENETGAGDDDEADAEEEEGVAAVGDAMTEENEDEGQDALDTADVVEALGEDGSTDGYVMARVETEVEEEEHMELQQQQQHSVVEVDENDNNEGDDEEVMVMDSLSTAALGRRAFSEPTVPPDNEDDNDRVRGNESTGGPKASEEPHESESSAVPGRSSINDYHAYLTLNSASDGGTADKAAPPFLSFARQSFEREEKKETAIAEAALQLQQQHAAKSGPEPVSDLPVAADLPPLSFDTLTGSTNYLPNNLPSGIEVPPSLNQTAVQFNSEVLQTADDEQMDDYIVRAYQAIRNKATASQSTQETPDDALLSSVNSLPPAPPLTSLEDSVALPVGPGPSALRRSSEGQPVPDCNTAGGDAVSAAAAGNPLSKSLMSDLLMSVNEENMDDYIARAYKAIRNKVVTEHHQQEYDRHNPLYNSVIASTAFGNTLTRPSTAAAGNATGQTAPEVVEERDNDPHGADSDPLSKSLVEFINQRDDEGDRTPLGGGHGYSAAATGVSSRPTSSASSRPTSEGVSPRQDINSLLHDIAESLNDGITVSPSYMDMLSPSKYNYASASAEVRRSSEGPLMLTSPSREALRRSSLSGVTSPSSRAQPAPLRDYSINSSSSSSVAVNAEAVAARPGSTRAAPVNPVQGIVNEFLGNKQGHKYHPLDTKLDYFPSSSSFIASNGPTSSVPPVGAVIGGSVEAASGGEDMDALRAQLQSTRILIDYKYFLEATRMNKRRIAMGHEILQMLQQQNEVQQTHKHAVAQAHQPQVHHHSQQQHPSAHRQVHREEGTRPPHPLDTFSVEDEPEGRTETEDFLIEGQDNGDIEFEDDGEDIEPRSVKSIEEPLRRSLTSDSVSSSHGRFIPGLVPNDSSGFQSILRSADAAEAAVLNQRPSTGGRTKSPHLAQQQQHQSHFPVPPAPTVLVSGYGVAPHMESALHLPTPPSVVYSQPSPVTTAPTPSIQQQQQQQYLYHQKASPLSPSRVKYVEHQVAAQQLIKQSRWDVEHHPPLQLPQVVYHAPIHPPQAPAAQHYDHQQLQQLHQYQQQQLHHQQQHQYQPPPPLPYQATAAAPSLPSPASTRPPNPVDQVIVIPVTSHPTGPPPVLRSQSAGRSSSRRYSTPSELPTVLEEASTPVFSGGAGGGDVIAEPESRKERIRSLSAGRGGSRDINSSKHTNYPQTKNAISCVCLAGSHFEQKRNEVLDLLDFYSGAGNSRAAKDFTSVQHLIELGQLKDKINHFILMFYKSNVQALKGVYVIDPMTDGILRIYGPGPRELPRAGESTVAGIIQGYMKYETSTKSFKVIPVKGVSSAVDAVIIDPAKAQKHKLSL